MSATIIPFPNARARPAGEMSQCRVVELAVGVAAQAHPSGFMDEMVRRIEKLRAEARRQDIVELMIRSTRDLESRKP